MAMTGDSVKIRPAGYSGAAKALHWIMGIIILCLVPAGLAMTHMAEGPAQNSLFSLHEEFGFLILWLAVLRLWVRRTRGAPAPAAGLTRFERIASTATHHLLYLLMFAMPLLGWFGKSAYGSKISLFGLVDVPALLPKNEAVSDALFLLHDIGGYLIAGLLVLHIGGAFMHAFVKGDGVFQRMLP